MGVPKEKSLCRRAREHYYDLLEGRSAAVPAGVRVHVEHCPFCQEQMRQLGNLLCQTGPADALASRGQEETVAALSLHFERIAEPVTCAHVKPFLPGLAAGAPSLRVPTPLTVHVEHCPSCAEDLAALRALRLDGAQLKRLGGLYTQSPGRDSTECRRARPAVAVLGSLSTGGVDPHLLDHVSTCPACRAAVYERRQRWPAAEAQGTAGRGTLLSCDEISPADLFDLVVPYGATKADREAGRVETVAAHIRACRRCLERVQALHHTIYNMAERADSEIGTIYRMAEGPGSSGADIGQECRYPVDVQVLHREPAPVRSREDSRAVPAAVGQHGSGGSSRRSLAKLALGAAAVLVLALLLPLHTPTASGTNVGAVLRSLESAPNVHIVLSDRRGTEPIQEMWVARRLQVLALKTGSKCVLYDLGKRQKRVRDPGVGLGAPIKLQEDEYASSRRIMADCVGRRLTAVAEDTRVRRMPGDTPDGLDRQVTYELASEKQTAAGTILSYRWRFVVDSATGLPHRMEFFSQGLPEGEWERKTTRTFEYLTEQDMQDAIKAMESAR